MRKALRFGDFPGLKEQEYHDAGKAGQPRNF